jgi:hypothetical protein
MIESDHKESGKKTVWTIRSGNIGIDTQIFMTTKYDLMQSWLWSVFFLTL